MEVVVAYDVTTETRAGERRLRKVATICLGFGQRVQKSVFECVLNEMQLEQMTRRLLGEIDVGEDSLRIYRLREPRERYLQVYGQRPPDLDGPLIV